MLSFCLSSYFHENSDNRAADTAKKWRYYAKYDKKYPSKYVTRSVFLGKESSKR